MATQLLSSYERQYITNGVREGLRADGRGRGDCRYFSLSCGVVSNTSGSARIQLDRTSAIVGIKAELGVPDPTTPNCGRIQFTVDCSALASPEFEGRDGEDLGQHLAHKLAQAYANTPALDCSSLSVIPGQQCWVIFVDALVLEWSGNVLGALSIAVRAALTDTKVPKLIVSGEGEECEVEVSDNPYDYTRLAVSDAPVIVALTQIGPHFVVDASVEEEVCSSSSLSLAVNRSRQVLWISKEGRGGIPFSKLHDIIMMAQDVASEVLERMDGGKDGEGGGLGTNTATLFT